jgi:hypothetical protein
VNLLKFHNLLTSSSDRAMIFRNFQEFRMAEPGGRFSVCLRSPKSVIDASQQYGGLVNVAKMVVPRRLRGKRAGKARPTSYWPPVWRFLIPITSCVQVRGGVGGQG